MKSLKTVVISAVVAVGFASAAFADETTTTTTTRSSDPGVKIGIPDGPGVTVGGTGCETKTTTHSNDEGDSVSKTRTNC